MTNAMPLSRPQRSALLKATSRELGWGLRAVSVELDAWRVLAEAIPDEHLREDALHALDAKRGHSDGAALFWTLPNRRDLGLLRLLVAYDVIYDYLDDVGERAAREGADDSQLCLALVDALDPARPCGDYYRDLPWQDDGGYLRLLVERCRAGCRLLPSFDAVEPLLRGESLRFTVLARNHEPDQRRRELGLRAWAGGEIGSPHDMPWYELSAAASHIAAVLALLAMAADASVTRELAEATLVAYSPWFGLAGTMLDAFVDQAEDRRSGAHSYVSHYPTHEQAVLRLCESVERSAERLLALPHGERHAVLLACMVAMYLSKDSARAPELREGVDRIRRAGGTLTAILLPVLRAWRICNGQASAT